MWEHRAVVNSVRDSKVLYADHLLRCLPFLHPMTDDMAECSIRLRAWAG